MTSLKMDEALNGQLKLVKNSPQALYMMDKEMGTRVFTPPTAAEGGA